MDQSEVIDKIKAQEQNARAIIEQAKDKASALVYEAKHVKLKEIKQSVEREIEREISLLKESFQAKTNTQLNHEEELTQQETAHVNSLGKKHKPTAIELIVKEILNQWPLQK